MKMLAVWSAEYSKKVDHTSGCDAVMTIGEFDWFRPRLEGKVRHVLVYLDLVDGSNKTS